MLRLEQVAAGYGTFQALFGVSLEVLAGGAISAEIIALDEPHLAFEVRYRFASREVFDAYERDHAPRLRAEGLQLFPVNKGTAYRRTLGVILSTSV